MHLILLTIIAALGAELLILGVALSYLDLEKGRKDQKAPYEATNDLEKAKSSLNRLLTTGDLVFGAKPNINTYLIPPMITQITQLERDCQELGERHVLSQSEMISMINPLMALKLHFSSLLKVPSSEGYQAYETTSQ